MITKWKIKPALGYQVNWSNPITRGLTGCILFNESSGRPNNLARATPITPIGTPVWGTGVAGAAVKCNISFSYSLSSIVLNALSGTVCAGVSPAFNNTDSGLPTSRYFFDSSGTRHAFYKNTSAGIQMHNDGRVTNFTGGIYSTGQYKQLTFIYDKSTDTQNLWCNGVQATGAPRTGTWGSTALGSNVYIGSRFSSTEFFSGDIFYYFIFNRVLNTWEIKALSDNPYDILSPIKRVIYNIPQGAGTTFNASALSINASLQQQTPSVLFSPSALNITAILTTPTKQIIALSSALSAALSLQTSTISGASNKTVTASPLTVTLSQPSVTLSGSSTTTVNVACLTMTASIQTSVQKGTILPNSLATAMALITATERVTLSPSSFSLIAVLNSVTFGGVQNRTILASALTANFTLFEPIVSQRYRSFLLHTKHNQPRYVNKVNAQRRIAKKNTVSGV